MDSSPKCNGGIDTEKGASPATSSHPSSNNNNNNPFRITQACERERHFPSTLDEAFASSMSSSIHCDAACLSISAQAALHDHNRHVARYGLEGTTQEGDDDDTEADGEETSLDRQWNALHSSHDIPQHPTEDAEESTTPNDGSQQEGAQPQLLLLPPTVPASHEERMEAIEVMTDPSLSYDTYFRNSSMELLKTPDSARRQNAPRSPTQRHPPPESSCNTTAASETDILLRLAGYVVSPVSKFDLTGDEEDDDDDDDDPPASSLFAPASLDRVHLSRISVADSSCVGVRSSNNNSLLLLNQSAISTCSASTLGATEQQQWPGAAAHNSPLRRGGASPRLPPRWSRPGHQAHVIHDSVEESKETTPTEDNMVSSSSLTAAEPTTPLLEDVLRYRFATSPLPPVEGGGNSFLVHNDDGDDDGPAGGSPQQLLSLSSISSPNTTTSIPKITTTTTKVTASPSPTSVLLLHPFAADDRRRYRTVVPHRVFFSEPSQFPFEQDSFSCCPVRNRHSA